MSVQAPAVPQILSQEQLLRIADQAVAKLRPLSALSIPVTQAPQAPAPVTPKRTRQPKAAKPAVSVADPNAALMAAIMAAVSAALQREAGVVAQASLEDPIHGISLAYGKGIVDRRKRFARKAASLTGKARDAAVAAIAESYLTGRPDEDALRTSEVRNKWALHLVKRAAQVATK